MSGPKRTVRARRPKSILTEEMVELYRRGCEILAKGGDDIWEEEGGRRREFLDISKRLNWTLLKRVGDVSVFEDLKGEPPGYMKAHNSAAHPDFNGWYSGRELQRQLQAAVEAPPVAKLGVR
jgi:hypothetical protein